MAEQLIQPKITGYRQLNDEEAQLMNLVKAKGQELGALLNKVETYLAAQRLDAERVSAGPEGADSDAGKAELARIDAAQPGRWLNIGRTDLQTGVMAVIRAIAQPGGF